MKITIPQHSVLGVYINSSIVAVVQDPTIEKIMTSVREELCADDITPTKPMEDIVFEWGRSSYFEVRIDNGDDVENQRTETVELMPIVIY